MEGLLNPRWELQGQQQQEQEQEFVHHSVADVEGNDGFSVIVHHSNSSSGKRRRNEGNRKERDGRDSPKEQERQAPGLGRSKRLSLSSLAAAVAGAAAGARAAAGSEAAPGVAAATASPPAAGEAAVAAPAAVLLWGVCDAWGTAASGVAEWQGALGDGRKAELPDS
ncbi:hypothetical protein ACSSS7_004201 [Eimeria intestinalis]